MTIVTRLVTALLGTSVALLPSPALAAEPPQTPSIIPPECPPAGCDPDLPGSHDHSATLSVAKAGGFVTSDVHEGKQILCGSVCSVTDVQTTDSPVHPETGWHTYTLSASGGPSGYSPHWTGCDGVSGSTCSVANNVEAGRAVTLTWRDTTAPTAAFAPPARVGPSNYNVTAGGTDNSGSVARYSWTVDDVAQGATGSVLSLAGFSHGAHTVTVRAYDAANNASAPVTRTVVVDKSVSLSVMALSSHLKQEPAITFSSTEEGGVLFACGVGAPDVSLTPCASPWQVPDLPDGQHTLRVRATDAVGNVAVVTRSFVLDSQAPAITVTDGPGEGAVMPGPATSITFEVVEENPGGVSCALDGELLACQPGTPVTLDGLAEGAHTFRVTATDAAGNEQALTRRFTRQRIVAQLEATAAASRYGEPAELTATVPTSSAARGEVVFRTGEDILCAADLAAGGTARCEAPADLDAGTHVVTATYSGDDTFTGATDHTELTVRRAATSLVAAARPKVAAQGARIRLIAAGLPDGASGTVAFRTRSGKSLCSGSVSDGKAACRTARSLKRGSYKAVAVYRGSQNHASSKDGFSFRITR